MLSRADLSYQSPGVGACASRYASSPPATTMASDANTKPQPGKKIMKMSIEKPIYKYRVNLKKKEILDRKARGKAKKKSRMCKYARTHSGNCGKLVDA